MRDTRTPSRKAGVVAAILSLAVFGGVVAHYPGLFGGSPANAQPRQEPGPAGAAKSGPLLFDLQGHRGARGLAPENTLTGFHKALTLGVDTLELDLGMTRDDVLVVTHDRALNPDIVRWPDGTWLNGTGPAIRTLTLDEVQRFDVGRLEPESRYARMFPEQEPADGERIPTLKEVVDLARAIRSDVRFNIEIKTDPNKPAETADPKLFAKALADLMREEELFDVATVQSFDYRSLVEIKRLEPRIATVCLSIQRANFDNIRAGQPGPSPWTAGLDVDDMGASVPALVRQAGCSAWSPHWRDLDAARLAEAKALGLKVVPWTVNKPEDLTQVLALPVDGVITDYPDRARKLMDERGIRSR